MTTLRYNTIPRARGPLIILGNEALKAAETIGPALTLVHNDAIGIRTDLYDITGDPNVTDEEAPRGKLALYLEQLAASVTATAALNLAMKDGRDFCSDAVAA